MFIRRTVTIPNGTSTSGLLNINDRRIVAVLMPAAWTAAAITFDVLAADGVTWTHLVDEANAEVSVVSAACQANQVIAIKTAPLRGLGTMRLRSGVAAGYVNQAAERIVTLLLGEAVS